MFKKLLATLAILALGVGLATAAATSAQAVGVTGTLVPWNEDNNHAEYWTTYGDHDPAECVAGGAPYGSVTNAGLTVTLNAFDSSWPGDHFELLVIKAGSDWNNVIVHPSSALAYASPPNGPGQQTTVSHWFICFGTTAPTPVMGSADVVNQTCDTTTGSLVSGSITPVATTGVVYELWNGAQTERLIEGFAVNSGPLDNGSYYVKVLPASSSYTVATTWLLKEVGAYDGQCVKAPTPVMGSADVVNQTCDTTTGSLVSGSITPVATTGVVYELWNAAKTTLLIANFAANSGPLANGLYYVKVLPASSAYTVLEGNIWLPKEVGAHPGACDETVKVVGDPSARQLCELDLRTLEPSGAWISTLTISTSAGSPTGSVEYRVYFDNAGVWVDKGVWPEGTYNAGDDPGNPYEIPFGTKVKVVAQATPGYALADPHEWVFMFSLPDLCVPTLGTVDPVVTFQQNCASGATYTLAIEGGAQGTVLWRLNGGAPTTQLGTFSVASPSSILIVATPGPDSGFNGEEASLEFPKEFGALGECLSTLALTGPNPVAPALSVAAFLGLLGIALVRSGARLRPRGQE